MVPLIFTVIIVTVVLQSLTATPLARLLKYVNLPKYPADYWSEPCCSSHRQGTKRAER